MAGSGREQGNDPFEIAARRENPATGSPDGFELSPDALIQAARRWPFALGRWSAAILASVVTATSIAVLVRSFTTSEPPPETQELEGRTPERDDTIAFDLSPDWTHTRGLDQRRHKDRRKERKPARVRSARIRVAGGPSRPRTAYAPVAPAAAGPNETNRTRGVARDRSNNQHRGKDRDHKGQTGPKLPEPSVPLYHLYRTFKKKKPNHYFTGDAAVKDAKTEDGWQFLATEGFMFDRSYEGTVAVPADNGVPGYIYEKKEPGSLPLYMLRGYNGYGDIFTSDAAYREKMVDEGWNDFGIIGYIAQT